MQKMSITETEIFFRKNRENGKEPFSVLIFKWIRVWVQAARMPSQLYIFLPLLLGQSMAFIQGSFSWKIFVLCHLYGLFVQLFIVFGNDIADLETDKINRTYNVFSGGSRVLVNKLLSVKKLATAACFFGLLCLIIGFLLGWIYGNWGPLFLILTGLVLLWAYSFKPLRISYRGGGEFLQMFGVGGILPVIGYLAQHGNLSGISWPLIGLMLLLALTCAMSTSLPDEPSDKVSSKTNSTVLLGNLNNQKLILALNGIALIVLLLIPVSGLRSPDLFFIVVLSFLLWISGIWFLGNRPGSH
jgi:1,4-dihydroxy-2-naphthoate polyprenyltransferase